MSTTEITPPTNEMLELRLSDSPGIIVSLCEHKERLFVATQDRVYELIDGIWRPMVFAIE